MCEAKIVLVSLSRTLLVAANFCANQAYTENKVGHHSKVKSQGPCENELKKYCLDGGQCYYLIFVGCNCTWLYGRKRGQKYMWWG